jgi:hypothetical protein
MLVIYINKEKVHFCEAVELALSVGLEENRPTLFLRTNHPLALQTADIFQGISPADTKSCTYIINRTGPAFQY